MSINVTYEHWKLLLGKLRAELQRITGFDGTIPDEAAFRDKFVDLPAEQHANDPDVNYGNFIRHHEAMVIFIREIDKTISLTTPESLSDLFWSTGYAAVEAIFEKGYEYEQFVNVIEDLNKEIRLDQNELAKYGRNPKVQSCLQAIFEAYIQCYLKLIDEAKTEDADIDLDDAYELIEKNIEIIKRKLVEWAKRREEAELESPRQPDDNPEIQWEKIKELGRGTFGVVDQVREVTTGTVYARKAIPKRMAGIDESSIESRVRNEVEIMMKLRHNHIASVNILIQGEKTWDIIMLPVADCDLRIFLEERCIKAKYPYDAMRLIDPWFGCLISALSFAHTQSIKHEDIKPNNVLIKNKTVYLTDFGTAKDFSELEASTADSSYEQGSPAYWAPEKRPWGRPADVWALGCVFAEMLTVRSRLTLQDFRRFRSAGDDKEYKYAFSSNPDMVKRWLKEKILKPQARDGVVMTLVEQVLNMLIVDHNQRPDARRVKGQLRQHDDRLFCATCA